MFGYEEEKCGAFERADRVQGKQSEITNITAEKSIKNIIEIFIKKVKCRSQQSVKNIVKFEKYKWKIRKEEKTCATLRIKILPFLCGIVRYFERRAIQ